MRTSILLAVLTASSIATAEPTKSDGQSASPVASQMASDDCARAHKAGKVCVLSIDTEDVNGAVPTGNEIGVALLQFKAASSLIHIRRDFIIEIIKTAEDL